ncbi:MAG TPA: hypothetical protein PKD86_18025, partial [Gemmatales bacterium]|nr:hypothetical protein [Gemmatales bacterium]
KQALGPLQMSMVAEVKCLDGTVVRRNGLETKQLGTSMLTMQFYHEVKADKLARCTLWGVNQKYAFELVRSNLETPYKVSEVMILAAGLPSFAESIGLAPPRQNDSKLGLYAPGLSVTGGYSCVKGYEWHEVFTKPEYKLRIVSAVRDPESPHLITVAGRYHHIKGKWEMRFSATFDSSAYSLPLACNLGDKDLQRVTTQTFGVVVNGLPLLSSSRTTLEPAPGGSLKFPDGPLVATETINYDPRLPRESDFILSAFGLPEPYGVEWDRPTPWWLYIGGGTLAVLVIVILGYRWRRPATEG